MALSPLQSVESRATKVTHVPAPSKTYALDFETGEISGLIDGPDAIRQFIRKAIATARFRFLIYDAQYGCELEDLIGQDVPMPLLQAEIPRVIREALIYDDRIADVGNFVIRREADALYVSFDVQTTEGLITEEVTV
ncbi:DUF2634 domain-containing protein [Paenibacillus elgii]|uniref:DUF2634 domain-containing protein n=1 Tax=Paenibacillus elgii TaxID=189691 RepID=UPI000248CEEE|nr:DUF2634 domain-containing protein [Paenibacillus elgii]